MDVLYAEGINPIVGLENAEIWGQRPVAYRGATTYDAGVVYTPYIPMEVTVTPVVPRHRRIGADGRIEERVDGVWVPISLGRELKIEVFKTETDAYLHRIGL